MTVHVLGRLLGWIGWLWVVAGFFGPAVGIPEINPFAGFILVFIGRIIRRRATFEPLDLSGTTTEESQPERPLNTERLQAPPPPRPRPVVREHVPEPETREDLLEVILGAGTELSEDETPATLASSDDTEPAESTPMSSAEMIARARDRFYRRPGSETDR